MRGFVPLYDMLVKMVAWNGGASADELDFVASLVQATLSVGPDKETYTDVLDDVGEILAANRAANNIDWALNLAEILKGYHLKHAIPIACVMWALFNNVTERDFDRAYEQVQKIIDDTMYVAYVSHDEHAKLNRLYASSMPPGYEYPWEDLWIRYQKAEVEIPGWTPAGNWRTRFILPRLSGGQAEVRQRLFRPPLRIQCPRRQRDGDRHQDHQSQHARQFQQPLVRHRIGRRQGPGPSEPEQRQHRHHRAPHDSGTHAAQQRHRRKPACSANGAIIIAMPPVSTTVPATA